MTNEDELKKAVDLIKAGRKKAGGYILADILREDPENERAWLWVTTCVDNDQERRYCLEQVLRINPNNHAAQKAIEKLTAPPAWTGNAEDVTPANEAPSAWDVPSEPAPIYEPTAWEQSSAATYDTNPWDQPFNAEDFNTSEEVPVWESTYEDSFQPPAVPVESEPEPEPEPEPSYAQLEADIHAEASASLAEQEPEVLAPADTAVLAADPAPRARRKLSPIAIIVIAVLLLFAVVGGGIYYVMNVYLPAQVERLQQTSGQQFQVEYIVSGSAPLITMSFSTATGAEESWDLRETPHSRTLSMGGMTPLMLSAKNKAGSGSVTCEIKVNGRTISTNSSSQANGQATCSGVVGLNP
jgi:hypothetical protein